jgi:hypothetical protein
MLLKAFSNCTLGFQQKMSDNNSSAEENRAALQHRRKANYVCISVCAKAFNKYKCRSKGKRNEARGMTATD